MNRIETNRLSLFPASQDQMQAMIDGEGDIGLKAAYREMLDGCLEHPEQWVWYAMWMIEMKDGKHIGDYCFKGPPVNGAVEIGYGINDAYRGQGYATEAVHAAAAWALDQVGVNCVEAEAELGNHASKRVLEKCGFRLSGIIGEEGPRYYKNAER
ncbi:MAG: GNAT family N-acetyltransferase [Oscillospiraceae bacterium]|nr:GNAT family N-acetyltransferase [Oscillospiraceae bacterium]